ncbi:MAG TPA: glycosyltransferase [Cyclobacteriaceae bacterium]|nr:glycosyltransferase [Cyclobacteriaceae bacterium]
MPSILLLPFHGIGHFNGLFGIARALQQTHEVTFSGVGFFLNHVTSQGFPYRVLSTVPFGLGLESWVHEIRKSKRPRWKNSADRWKDQLYHDRRAELTRVLNEIKPVHVLVDAAQATDVIVLKSIDPGLRVSVVHVAPPYLLLPGLPPANSLALPGNEKLINEDHIKALRGIWDKRWRQRFKYLAPDDRWIVERRLRRNHMFNLKSDYRSLFTFAVKNVDQYVLTYREFDFYDDRLSDLKYVGPHIDPGTVEKNKEEFIALIDRQLSKGRKIVYCSFGTVPPDRDISRFLTMLGELATELNCFVIVSAKHTGSFEADGENTVVYDWVPQWTVLSKCDMFITHGGINSVHDAIRYGVPMLVYPLALNYDQNGNSARVVHRGLGLRGHLKHDTIQELRKKMVDIFNDIKFRKNLEAFQKNISGYTTGSFVKMIT